MTPRSPATAAASQPRCDGAPNGGRRADTLILSLFPGIDLLGRAFEAEGYCVVRGPDVLWGGDIRDFHPPAGRFEGIIAGSPCQDFSRARRSAPTGEGVELLREFLRCVAEASPEWFLLENVPGVPDVVAAGYGVQRFDVRATEVGLRQRRLRHFQFGSRCGQVVVLKREATAADSARSVTSTCMASEGSRKGRRGWADFCELQGLPRDFELPGMTLSQKYSAVGNGVPVPMGRFVARAIRDQRPEGWTTLCVCGCGRPVTGRQQSAGPACRKRLERSRRDSAGGGRRCVVTSRV